MASRVLLPLEETTTAAGDAPDRGLVLCPKSGRNPATARFSAPSFPSPELVGMAAASLRETSRQTLWAADRYLAETTRWKVGTDPGPAGVEGPRWFVTISPGSIKIGSTDLARGQRAAERAVNVHRSEVALMVSDELAGHERSDGDPERIITGWSRKSRANMVRRLVTLDYTPMVDAGRFAMVTMTYPGEWLVIAPDGAAVKAHLYAFRKRLTRKFGKLCVVWKLEYQRRGAPHFHLLTTVPEGVPVKDFRAWCAQAWSDVLDHPDPVQRQLGLVAGTAVDMYEGTKMTDPKRISIYFTKHGLLANKGYQNEPPAEWEGTGSVGRFWGRWNLDVVEVPVEVGPAEALLMSRTLRRWQHQHRYLRAKKVLRTELRGDVLVESLRTVRRPVRRMPGSAGFLSVNDGPSVAMMLDRVLAGARMGTNHRGVVGNDRGRVRASA
jgi:hypothetical protein